MTERVVVFNNMVTPYTSQLYDELRAAGVDITILSCTRQEANRSWADTIVPSYPHEILPGREFRLGTGRYAHVNTGIFAALGRLRPDHLIINGFYPSMLTAAVWAMTTRTKLSLTIDGWRHTMPQSPLHRLVRPFILRRCRAVIVCGDKGREYFRSAGLPVSRIFTVPLAPAWRGPAETPPFAARPYQLVWCAHLNNSMKNARFLVAAAVALKPRIRDLKLRIVGAGPDEAETLDALTAAGVPFKHDRYIDWRDMAAVFTSARMLMLPSLWEPWGLVCNEAMQCGTPCIVSPFVGAGEDLVRDGENGYVAPLDPALWAERIAGVVTDEAHWASFSEAGRAAMGERGIERSAAAFSAMLEASR